MARRDDTNPTNEHQAASALQSQTKYEDAWPDWLVNSIVDLVTNLLYLAHLNDIEPDYIIHMAQTHFDIKVKEDAGL